MINKLSGFALRVFGQRNAYRALFQPGGQLNPASEIVLLDLRRFCRADESTTMVSPVSGAVDPIASAQAEGRREVWLRIMQNLHISDADLYAVAERQRQQSEQET